MKITKEQQVLQQVVTEAWENADFKKKLLADPVNAIEELTGEKLNIPEGKTFVVKDQTDESTVYINIPAMPEVDIELSTEELEKVAGGCQHGDSGVINPITFPQYPKILNLEKE